MKIRPVGAKLFHADGRTDTQHDEVNSRFRNFANALKNHDQFFFHLARTFKNC